MYLPFVKQEEVLKGKACLLMVLSVASTGLWFGVRDGGIEVVRGMKEQRHF